MIWFYRGIPGEGEGGICFLRTIFSLCDGAGASLRAAKHHTKTDRTKLAALVLQIGADFFIFFDKSTAAFKPAVQPFLSARDTSLSAPGPYPASNSRVLPTRGRREDNKQVTIKGVGGMGYFYFPKGDGDQRRQPL